MMSGQRRIALKNRFGRWFCVSAILLISSLPNLGIAGSSPAGAVKIFNLCSDATEVGPEFDSVLEKAGWLQADPKAPTDWPLPTNWPNFLGFAIIATLSADASTPIDWQKALDESKTSINTILRNRDSGPVSIYGSGTQKYSILAVKDISDQHRHGVLCIFGGPLEQKMAEQMDALAHRSHASGMEQATPEVEVFHIHRVRQKSESNPSETTIEAVLARYVQSLKPVIGQESRVEVGFSMRKFTRK